MVTVPDVMAAGAQLRPGVIYATLFLMAFIFLALASAFLFNWKGREVRHAEARLVDRVLATLRDPKRKRTEESDLGLILQEKVKNDFVLGDDGEITPMYAPANDEHTNGDKS